ncbi:MAG TPA: pyridoxamine 5'-phosphate oxidase family protein [Puia sp.]
MFGYLPVTFIQEKVRDLENALFFSMSDAVLKIPSCLVKVLEADELGHLWFIIPKPSQFIHAFDRNFPVKLDFFRKGRDYYLKIFGMAFLVNDPEEINNVECLNEQIKKQVRENDSVLIKVKISHADYVENAPAGASAKDILRQVKQKIYRWFQLSQSTADSHFSKIPAELKYPSATSFYN